MPFCIQGSVDGGAHQSALEACLSQLVVPLSEVLLRKDLFRTLLRSLSAGLIDLLGPLPCGCDQTHFAIQHAQQAAHTGGVAALALASGAAGSNDTKTLGEAELVGGDGAVDVTSDPAQADAPAEIIETNYFDAARLSRQEARDEALSILQSTVDDPNADAETIAAASESITAMASATTTESEIENLVAAKGYADCVAFMGDDAISIVVSTEDGTLDAADVAKITDIAMTETGYAASAIRIMAAN